MNTPSAVRVRVRKIQQELAGLGEIHPGSLSAQYNVCGREGCRCKHPTKPRRHGPYYQLSYTHRGRHTTRFVRAEELAAMRARLTNWKRLKTLVDEWVELCLRLSRHSGEVTE